jgi:hypothetical protein
MRYLYLALSLLPTYAFALGNGAAAPIANVRAPGISDGSCVAVLVAPDLLLTAGGCLANQSACDSASFRFTNGAEARCRKIEARHEGRAGDHGHELLDFSLVRLQRSVEGVSPATFINGPGVVRSNEELSVSGQASSIRVRELRPFTFTADFPAPPPSGAGVFHRSNGKLAGIVAKGAGAGSAVVVKLDEILVRLPLGTL